MISADQKCNVSVCMPTFNGSKYLRKAIESALSQTYTGIELLIIDDASTDDTLSIAEDFASLDSRVRIHRNERRLGLAGNWNRCLELARGDWIKFLFQDDYITSDCIEQMLKSGLSNGAIFVVCDRNVVFEPEVREEFKQDFLSYVSEHSLSRRFPGRSRVIESAEFARHVASYPVDNCIGEPTAVMFHRSAVQRFGYFISDLVQKTDWEYWMRLAVNAGICYLPDKLATFRLHGRATSLLNQSDNEFRSVVIDPLIIYHELVYNPLYANLRKTAKNILPQANLKYKLFFQYKYARSIVNLHKSRAGEGKVIDSPVADEWKGILSKYPRLTFLPITCFPMRAWGRVLKTFRSLNERRKESVG